MKLPIRRISQISFLILIIMLALLHQKYGIQISAPIDAYCPFGAIEGVFTYIIKGEFLQKLFFSNFILLFLIIVFTLVFGRFFCGFVCPLGYLQELFKIIGNKLGFKTISIPSKFNKWLNYLKYVILILIVMFSYIYKDLIFRPFDPFAAMMHFGSEFDELFWGYIILFLIIIISLFAKTLWCRYLCPLGAFFGIIKKFSFLKINQDKGCIGCMKCNLNCPSGIDVKSQSVVKDLECISCMDCVSSCPKGVLKITIFGKSISSNLFSIIVFLGFWSLLIIVVGSPFWKTKGDSNIRVVSGKIDTSTIRGSNTLEFVIEQTGIPFEAFVKEFGLPLDMDKNTMIKELSSKYGAQTSDGNAIHATHIREFIDKYQK